MRKILKLNIVLVCDFLSLLFGLEERADELNKNRILHQNNKFVDILTSIIKNIWGYRFFIDFLVMNVICVYHTFTIRETFSMTGIYITALFFALIQVL